MLKRIFSIFAISLIITGLFFEGYSLKCPVYADTESDQWTQVTTNEQLVEAFRYYCKSRDLTIEGSVADAVTKFTTKAFNGLCNTLGIDITQLQAELKYQTDGNTGTRFLFTATGIDAYNRIFAQFLQDNELEIGDTDVNKEVYSGALFTDSEGRSCLIYIVKDGVQNNAWVSTDINDVYISTGTTYRFNDSDLGLIFNNLSNGEYTEDYYINGIRYSFYAQKNSSGWKYLSYSSNLGYGTLINYTSGYIKQSNCNIGICLRNNNYYLFANRLNLEQGSSYNKYRYTLIADINDTINSDNTKNTNIYIQSTTINNNNYEGDTIINNNGTTGDDDTPIIPPYPDYPTPDPPTLPDDGGWQDFQLPNMPNDWLIYGMEKKFPFDIPFNIMFGLSLLNHEPEIPKFEGDIDLKVCTWHYDIDLTPFDGIAQILRKFEVLAFIIGLAILTKELIMWG